MEQDKVGEVGRGQLMPCLLEHVKQFEFHSNGSEKKE